METIKCSRDLQFDSIVDGTGLRCVLWTQGCPHCCIGCHNPQTHDPNAGFEVSVESIKSELKKHFYLNGITFSGGEPMDQPSQCAEIAKFAHEIGFDVWCFTGYSFETLINKQDSSVLEFLKEIDVLVDGPFILSQKSLDVKFRGSTNQRLIDVKSSLKNNYVIEVFL